MATVYSLVCWGGLSGKQISGASATDIFTLTNHGLRNGTGIVPQTTGGGITSGTTYYANVTESGLTANTFYLYTTQAYALAGGATGRVNVTATITNVYFKSAYMLGLTTEQFARYGSSGSERLYNRLIAYQTARAYQPLLGDSEVCEIGEAFTEITTTFFDCSLLCNASNTTITTLVNGVRSNAWHGGDVTKGFWFSSSNGTSVLNPNTYNMTIDGIIAIGTYNGGVKVVNPGSLSFNTVIKNCIISGNIVSTSQFGCCLFTATSYINNIIYNIGGTGIATVSTSGLVAINNIVTKCVKGFDSTTGSGGMFANNISVGNTVNYEDCPSYASVKSFNNVGEVTDKISFTASAGSSTLTFASTHGRAASGIVVFDSTGTLPTVGGVALEKGKAYVVRSVPTTSSVTIANNSSETAFVFDGIGTGTHTMFSVWCSETPLLVDMTAPEDIFVDWGNNDFRLVAGSPLINAGIDSSASMDAKDMLGNVRPNYESATYPDNLWDVGPFEYDHGEGDAPETLTISNLTTGSRVIATRADTNASLGTAAESSGTATISIGYSGTVNIEARNASGTPAYIPWTTQISFPTTKNVIALQQED